MNTETQYVFNLVSTFSVVPSLIAGSFIFKKIEIELRLYVGFLLLGLIADLMGWYFFLTENEHGNLYTTNIYSLLEAVFLTLFISKVSSNKLIKFVFAHIWIVFIPVWCIGFFFRDIIKLSRTSSEVMIAFASCFCLLKIVETNQAVFAALIFWILLGVFFYFFSTFFFMSLLATKLGIKIWYLHNLINIATNLIYFVGILRVSFGKSADICTQGM